MKKYIDSENLISELTTDNMLSHFDSVEDAIENRFRRAIERIISNFPAADVKPVVRGKWIQMSDADGDYYCCSVCGNELPKYEITQVTVDNPFPNLKSIYKTPLCPNCGAKMDGGKEDGI